MSIFLFPEEVESKGKISIDELYEKNHQRDLKQLSVFNKILARVHKRIKVTARNKTREKHVWFIVPDFLFGEPVYDCSDCIAYIVSKLADNGFRVKYVHPNTLFISWDHWIPQYVRAEVKKRTGKVIDEKGQIVETKEKEQDCPDDGLFNIQHSSQGQSNMVDVALSQSKGGKQFTPISNYKPTGKLVYDPNLFNKLQEKL